MYNTTELSNAIDRNEGKETTFESGREKIALKVH